jgi:hypothetical protein
MLLILSAQAMAKSRKSKHSFEWNQSEVLPQTVTKIWRAELGTMLFNGFNSTTGGSAYFHHPASTSLPHRRPTPVPLPYGPGHRVLRFLGGQSRLKAGCGQDCPPHKTPN